LIILVITANGCILLWPEAVVAEFADAEPDKVGTVNENADDGIVPATDTVRDGTDALRPLREWTCPGSDIPVETEMPVVALFCVV
jgi:hypothetical protein